MSNQKVKDNKLSKATNYILLALSILFIIFLRYQLLSFPLERDEGEFALMGKMILDGNPPYTLAYNMKLPGTYYMYALFMALFGETIEGIHIGLLLMIVASMYLLFLISKQFVSDISAVIASLSFGLLGTSFLVLGQAAHATHFVSFFAICGTYFLIRKIHQKADYKWSDFFLSGLFFSLALIAKQHGLFFSFFGLTTILIFFYKEKPLKSLLTKILYYGLGALLPMVLLFGYIYLFADFENFWYWTFTYLREYGGLMTAEEGFTNFKTNLATITGYNSGIKSIGYIQLWVTALVGLFVLFFSRFTWPKKLTILSLCFFSFLTILPGLYFRHHYFITLLPALGILIAIVYDFLTEKLALKMAKKYTHFIVGGLFIFLISYGIKDNAHYLFTMTPNDLCKTIYTKNPFSESINLALALKETSTEEDKIAILGSEPQILFYADRMPATGYIYMYNLMEQHPLALTMQKQMTEEIEAANPKYIVYVNANFSWLNGDKNDETFVFEWANDYLAKNYQCIAYQKLYADNITTLQNYTNNTPIEEPGKDIIYVYVRNN